MSQQSDHAAALRRAKERIARDFTLHGFRNSDRPAEPERALLSSRETEAVKWLSHGFTISMVAMEMGVSENTVKTWVRQAKLKLGAKTAAHLVAICLREELFP